jgi:hypothetical protein
MTAGICLRNRMKGPWSMIENKAITHVKLEAAGSRLDSKLVVPKG